MEADSCFSYSFFLYTDDDRFKNDEISNDKLKRLVLEGEDRGTK